MSNELAWDYAELTHTAKEFGGPQALIDAIYDGGRADGLIEGTVGGALGVLALGGLACGVSKIYKKVKSRSETAKEVLIETLEEQPLEAEATKDTSSDLPGGQATFASKVREKFKKVFNKTKTYEA